MSNFSFIKIFVYFLGLSVFFKKNHLLKSISYIQVKQKIIGEIILYFEITFHLKSQTLSIIIFHYNKQIHLQKK